MLAHHRKGPIQVPPKNQNTDRELVGWSDDCVQHPVDGLAIHHGRDSACPQTFMEQPCRGRFAKGGHANQFVGMIYQR